MAFFSIGLTLNLTGVQLNQLHARDLKPSSVRRNFYQANAHVVRYVENLRAVYELESRVRDLQRTSDNEDSPSVDPDTQVSPDGANHEPKPKKPVRPGTGSGTSRRGGVSPSENRVWQVQAASVQDSSNAAVHLSHKVEAV